MSTTSNLHEWHFKLFVKPCTFQKCILSLHFDIHFWKIAFKHVRTVILEQEVHMCKILIFLYRKSMKHIIPIFIPNVSYDKHTLPLKIWVQCMTKYDLQKVLKLKTHFSRNWFDVYNIGTSLTILFNWMNEWFCSIVSNNFAVPA